MPPVPTAHYSHCPVCCFKLVFGQTCTQLRQKLYLDTLGQVLSIFIMYCPRHYFSTVTQQTDACLMLLVPFQR